MPGTILIVDDEKNIVDILSFNLKKEGYEVVPAYDGEAALSAYGAQRPDLILLDVMLPLLDGFEVCKRIREKDVVTPIIMLTAREEETDKVFGLELGADDYITKPFSLRELTARVKANMRRILAEKTAVDESSQAVSAAAARFNVDCERFDVYIDGAPAGLTQREFELIRLLSAQPEKIFSREDLMRDVWQFEFFGDARAVDVAIRRLREKIESDPANPRRIITKRGIGYYYLPDE